MAVLHIIRGLPGSGKSTLAANMRSVTRTNGKFNPVCVVVEADQFFLRNGHYVYDKRLIGTAHSWCFATATRDLRCETNVIVANTFTKLWEMERYFELQCILPKLKIFVTELKTQFENVHGVPKEKVEEMATRWEEIPEETIRKYNIQFNRIQTKDGEKPTQH